MKKLKYAVYHGKILILVLIIAVFFISSGIHGIIAQLNSQRNGIEILLIDTSVAFDNTSNLEDDIKDATKIEHVGVATLIKEDALKYVSTIQDYTFSDYVEDLTVNKDSEAIFVTKGLLNDVYAVSNIVPAEIEGNFGEECYHNGVLYAVPIASDKTVQYETSIITLQENVYSVLLNGDHVNEMRAYVQSLIKEEDPNA